MMKKIYIPKNTQPIKPSEITDETVFNNRRDFFKVGAATVGGMLLPNIASATTNFGKPNKAYQAKAKLTAEKRATTYNNYYELGTDKADPARNAKWLVRSMKKNDPWTIEVSGEVASPIKSAWRSCSSCS